MKTCTKPKPGPYKREDEFEVNPACVSESYELITLGWMIASALSRSADEAKIPGFAGYKSLVAQVGALPLLPEIAQWPTMLTVMFQASQIKRLIVGQDLPTVITFDMALYEKSVQLLDARLNLRNETLPTLGELHIVKAALRDQGTSIENSGIDNI